MRRKGFKLEYYAFEYDFNKKDLCRVNVFYNIIVENLVKNLVKKKITNYDGLYEFLRKEFFYYFHSKAEHEVLVSDLFAYGDNLEHSVKIDVYYQLEPNLDIICEHVINELRLDKDVFKK